jgi:hypothetical protein
MNLEDLTHATETELRRFYVAACTEKFLDTRMFIRNTGVIEFEGRAFKAGIKGQSDVWGWLYRPPYPMPLEIELKNVLTPVTPEQKVWAAYCKVKTVPYLQLRAEKGKTPKQVIDAWVIETGFWLEKLRRMV